MEPLEITRLILLALHILGLAAIIGAFFVQMRKKSDYNLIADAVREPSCSSSPVLALVGVREASDLGVNYDEDRRQAHHRHRRAGRGHRRGRAAAPRQERVTVVPHGGGLAIVNVLVAVLWQ